jgi:hypothetical protein
MPFEHLTARMNGDVMSVNIHDASSVDDPIAREVVEKGHDDFNKVEVTVVAESTRLLAFPDGWELAGTTFHNGARTFQFELPRPSPLSEAVTFRFKPIGTPPNPKVLVEVKLDDTKLVSETLPVL